MTGTQWNGEDNEILPADFDEDTVSINQILKLHDIRVVFSLPMTSVMMSQALSPASFQRPPPTHPNHKKMPEWTQGPHMEFGLIHSRRKLFCSAYPDRDYIVQC